MYRDRPDALHDGERHAAEGHRRRPAGRGHRRQRERARPGARRSTTMIDRWCARHGRAVSRPRARSGTRKTTTSCRSGSPDARRATLAYISAARRHKPRFLQHDRKPSMSAMFRITLPDGSVREVAPGTTPADVAAAIGPGLAKAALAARVDGECAISTRPFEGDAAARAGDRARRGGRARTRPPRSSRTSWRRRCSTCSPARRSPSAPRPTTASITTSRRRTAPSPRRTCPRSRRRCARSSRATSRSCARSGAREQLIDTLDASRARRFKAEWAAELPEGEELTIYRQGEWLDMCRGPHMASTGKLDPAGVQADARVGRLLARRPEERDAQPHLRHRLAQQEAARRSICSGSRKRPSATIARSAQEMDLFHLQSEAQGSVFWHPKGYHAVAPAGGVYAPPARRGRL